MLGVQGVFLIGPRSPINNDTRVQAGTRLGLPAIHLSQHQVCRKACFPAQRRLLDWTVQGLILLHGFVFLPCPEFKASSRSTSRSPGVFQSRLEFPSGADLSAREAHTPRHHRGGSEEIPSFRRKTYLCLSLAPPNIRSSAQSERAPRRRSPGPLT